MINRNIIGVCLLVWSLGMGVVILLSNWLQLPKSFTWAHVVGATCVGTLIDYLVFCRRPSREINLCERCGKSLKGLRVIREDTCQFKKEGA